MDINYHEEEFYDFSGTETKKVKNPNYIPGCERTWLIQRLKSPVGDSAFGLGGTFIKNGGFTEEAHELVRKVCHFDYMGSAEFEFGAVSQAFQRMAGNIDDLEAYLFTVSGRPELPFPGLTVEYLFNMDYGVKTEVLNAHTVEVSVFVLAPKVLRPHVEQVIQVVAAGNCHLKELPYMNETIFTFSDWEAEQEYEPSKTLGWLELDNGFAFFSCEKMWRNFCQLFGVEITPDVMDGFVEPDFTAVDEALRAAAQ